MNSSDPVLPDRSHAILPGARVRARDGLIGTVERLEYAAVARDQPSTEGNDDQLREGGQPPTALVVRADDGRWRYRLPLLLVSAVTQGAFYTIVQLSIGAEEVPYYIAEDLTRAEDRTAPATDGAPAAVPERQDGAWLPDAQDATLRLPLAAEELTITKRPVELGTIHLHKGVRTVDQTKTIPLYHEEAVIEHISPAQYDPSAPTAPNEVIIPIVEEQLVVEKKTVITEYIRVRKDVHTAQQEVRDTVRQEFVEVTEQRLNGGDRAMPPLLHELPPTQERSGDEADQAAHAAHDAEARS